MKHTTRFAFRNSGEVRILQSLVDHGSITLRRARVIGGPEMIWYRLSELDIIRIYHTPIGRVVTVSPTASERLSPDFRAVVPFRSPLAAAERALMSEALLALEEEGYTVHDLHYKRVGTGKSQTTRPFGEPSSSPWSPHPSSGSVPTRVSNQVLHATLQVPPALLAQMDALKPELTRQRHLADEGNLNHSFRPHLGRPPLYVVRGDSKAARAKFARLVRQASTDASRHLHPLLIGVTDIEPYRHLLRQDHFQAERARKLMWATPNSNAYERLLVWDMRQIRVVHLPTGSSSRPRLVT